MNVLQMKHNLSQVADKLERVDKLLWFLMGVAQGMIWMYLIQGAVK